MIGSPTANPAKIGCSALGCVLDRGVLDEVVREGRRVAAVGDQVPDRAAAELAGEHDRHLAGRGGVDEHAERRLLPRRDGVVEDHQPEVVNPGGEVRERGVLERLDDVALVLQQQLDRVLGRVLHDGDRPRWLEGEVSDDGASVCDGDRAAGVHEPARLDQDGPVADRDACELVRAVGIGRGRDLGALERHRSAGDRAAGSSDPAGDRPGGVAGERDQRGHHVAHGHGDLDLGRLPSERVGLERPRAGGQRHDERAISGAGREALASLEHGHG